MNKTVIVYVCDGEFNDFEGAISDAGNTTYKVCCDGTYLFFAVENAEEVHNAKKAVNSDLPPAMLVEKIEQYLDTLYAILLVFFGDESLISSTSVYIVTHWGGGSPEDIKKKEETIKEALKQTKDNRFRGWVLFSVSESFRPHLFSEKFSTVVARQNNTKAKLPDAKECESILIRYQNKEYGASVNWSEQDSRKLYNDIMEHLNH